MSTTSSTSATAAVSPPPAQPQTSPSQEPVSKASAAVAVPKCSAWFSLDAVSPVERRLLPEFFTGASPSKTPLVYMKYRNFMVHAYRQQPHVYLTATACRRNLAGDACAVLRVHEFLTHWGIINYSVPPHALPPAIHPNYALKPASTSALAPTAAAPLAVLRDASAPARTAWKCEVCAVGDVAFELTPDAKRRVTDATANGGINTSNASGAGATKEMALGVFCVAPGAGLCDDCFLNRAAFPDGVDAADFARIEPPAQWTAAETNQLLEAVAASGRDSDESCDWNVVAAKLRSKTAEECMLRFLELPILQQAGASAASDAAASDVLQRPFAYAQALNAPVLSMAALLAHVDPFVAKAAARAAIRAVHELHSMVAGGVKSEATAAAAAAAAAPVSLEQAAAAVASSAEVAGIADPVKAEVSADDVEMKDPALVAADAAPLLTKEAVAVAHEASGATAAALLAVRAHTLAEAAAAGPVRGLVAELVQNQLQQMELKMRQLSLLESAVVAEKERLQQEKYQLYVDRLALAQDKLGGAGSSSSATAGAAAAAATGAGVGL
ncbi:hypothetical protein PybrP1_003832 [[Pythium] brassicae (nom. inval.)]|nr:hypothetical protein PybrP1_003832 [[Pythium] brassicae (nom. inval.)]